MIGYKFMLSVVVMRLAPLGALSAIVCNLFICRNAQARREPVDG